MIAILDYGAGNLTSVKNALDFIGAKSIITDKITDLKEAEKIVFPGVGAFGDVIHALKKKGLLDFLRKEIPKKPYLGICLGLQVLFDTSEESPGAQGLGLIPGDVVRFRGRVKIPQIGWNSNKFQKQTSLFKGIKDNTYFYFVHSYYVMPKEDEVVIGRSTYGEEFVNSIAKGNIFGVQFHPERSSEVGLQILKNFIAL